jgi:hypothetical protein
MQIADAKILREITDVNRANALIAEGWSLLAIVPGYDHRQAQPATCYVLGMAELPEPDA